MNACQGGVGAIGGLGARSAMPPWGILLDIIAAAKQNIASVRIGDPWMISDSFRASQGELMNGSDEA